jgi:hypothetical protein
MSMNIDFSDFEKGLQQLVKESEPKETAKGLFKAGNQLLKDAIEERPFAPFDEGNLRGSARTDKAEVTKDGAEVVAGFNIEYAARWHELTTEEDARINWSLPGSGRKYLESKLAQFKDDYLAIVGEHLKRVLGGQR